MAKSTVPAQPVVPEVPAEIEAIDDSVLQQLMIAAAHGQGYAECKLEVDEDGEKEGCVEKEGCEEKEGGDDPPQPEFEDVKEEVDENEEKEGYEEEEEWDWDWGNGQEEGHGGEWDAEDWHQPKDDQTYQPAEMHRPTEVVSKGQGTTEVFSGKGGGYHQTNTWYTNHTRQQSWSSHYTKGHSKGKYKTKSKHGASRRAPWAYQQFKRKQQEHYYHQQWEAGMRANAGRQDQYGGRYTMQGYVDWSGQSWEPGAGRARKRARGAGSEQKKHEEKRAVQGGSSAAVGGSSAVGGSLATGGSSGSKPDLAADERKLAWQAINKLLDRQ